MSTFRVRLTQGDSRTGGGNLDELSRKTGPITAATNTTPVKVTSANHGLVTGTRLTVMGVGGNTGANGNYTITVNDANTFTLRASEGNDTYTSGGSWVIDSVQRTVYVTGPNMTYRKFKDGEVFTDCNYWKRFMYPNVPLNESFIEVVSDDGGSYTDGQESGSVKSYTLTISAATTYTDTTNIADFLTDTGAAAKWASITVTGDEVKCRVNGQSASTFTISAGTTHTFNTGDVLIEKLTFDNSESGATEATVTVLGGVSSFCKT